MTSEFAEFWYRYPRRVGKLAAQRAYVKARRSASAADILAGVDRYVATKPTWQEWAHPSSWLNGGRWMDEVAEAPPRREWVCPHTPPCSARGQCHILERIAAGKLMGA